jgi:hypothetical protein
MHATVMDEQVYDAGMAVIQKSFLRALLVLALAVVVTAMVVPFSVIEYVLNEFAWARGLARFLDTVAPQHQLDYLLPFAALGFLARFAWRSGRSWQVAACIFLVAAVVELVQIWTPGRDAAIGHVILDVLGGVFGFAMAWLGTYAWGSEAVGSGAPPERLWYFSTMQAPPSEADEEVTRPRSGT